MPAPRTSVAAHLLTTLVSSLLLLLLTACDGRESFEGATWQPPAEKELPLAFSEQANVPEYAHSWRMPEGFRGFAERWNRRNRDYVQKACETARAEYLAAMQQRMQAIPGSEVARSADVALSAALQKYQTLMQRSKEGDYLRLLPTADLPQNLKWQYGNDEPELGSRKARKGGTLRLSLQRSFPATLSLFGPNSNNATRRYIYDDIDMPLIRIHPGTGRLIPGTADRWAVSEDGRTVYFHIDEQARFSNGDLLTTRDFVTSMFVRTSEYSAEPFYGTYYLRNFSHITIYGNNVLAVTLPSARPYAAYYAAIPASCTRFYAEFGPDYATRYLWRPVPTTGAYSIDPAGLVMGRMITLKRVRNWWARDRKYTRYSCNVDRIVYSFIAEAAKARELFRIGELDVIPCREADLWYEGLEIDAVHKGYVQRVHFSNIWPRSSLGFHINCTRAPFDNINMREGLQHALNVQAVINTVFRGDAERLGSYFSGFGVYTDPTITARPYDPEKARACFARAGYTVEGGDGILHKPDGTRLQVVISSRIDPVYANCFNLLRESAADCGLDLRYEQMDDTVYFSKIKDKNYSVGIFSWGFSPILPDPSQFFLSGQARRADGSPAKGTNNIMGVASSQLDAAIFAASNARTEEEAVHALHLVQQLIDKEACWVPGWATSHCRFAQWRWIRWPDTAGCRFCPPRYYDPMDSHLYWIDEEERAATLRARANNKTYEEQELVIPLPHNAARRPKTTKTAVPPKHKIVHRKSQNSTL